MYVSLQYEYALQVNSEHTIGRSKSILFVKKIVTFHSGKKGGRVCQT